MGIGGANATSLFIVRRVALANNLIQIDDAPMEFAFYGNITPPDGPGDPGTAPRDAPPAMLRHASGLTGPRTGLGLGDRVAATNEVVYEIVDRGEQIMSGRRLVGMDFAVMRLSELYPIDADLRDMDGVSVKQMSVAIWDATEEHADQGEYENYEGEAPPEFTADLKRNLDIFIPATGARYRIIAAEPDVAPPRVRLRLRKADA